MQAKAKRADMQEKVWSRSWLNLWFFRCWGGMWFLTALIAIGSWDLAGTQRKLLENHVVVPTIVQGKYIQEVRNGTDNACLDVIALLPNPRGLQFRHCVAAFDVEEVKVGDQMQFLVSPDGQQISRGPAAVLEQRVRSNAFMQPFVRAFFIGLTIFMAWRFVSALFARRGEEVWVKVTDAEIIGGSTMGGGTCLRVSWKNPRADESGRTRNLALKWHMPDPSKIKKRAGIRMYRSFTGRLWWEAELPGFVGELTKFPGKDAAGWPKTSARP